MNHLINFAAELGKALMRGELAFAAHPCPACERARIWVKYGRASRQVRCIGCGYTNISLSVLQLAKELKLPEDAYVYEMSYHGAVFEHLRRNFKNFFFSEYFGKEVAKGALHHGTRHEDIQELSFANEQFALVSCVEVLEHVPDYRAGIRQVHRVLKNGGVFLFTVPLFDADRTEKLAEQGAYGLIWLQEPEFHDSRVWGAGSVPVFWRHSAAQLEDELRQVGFADVALVALQSPFKNIQQCVFRCIK